MEIYLHVYTFIQCNDKCTYLSQWYFPKRTLDLHYVQRTTYILHFIYRYYSNIHKIKSSYSVLSPIKKTRKKSIFSSSAIPSHVPWQCCMVSSICWCDSCICATETRVHSLGHRSQAPFALFWFDPSLSALTLSFYRRNFISTRLLMVDIVINVTKERNSNKYPQFVSIKKGQILLNFFYVQTDFSLSLFTTSIFFALFICMHVILFML